MTARPRARERRIDHTRGTWVGPRSVRLGVMERHTPRNGERRQIATSRRSSERLILRRLVFVFLAAVVACDSEDPQTTDTAATPPVSQAQSSIDMTDSTQHAPTTSGRNPVEL